MMIVSLFIILLAFFIVLNSMAVIDDKRRLAALGSLIGSFGILPGGLSPGQGGEMKPAAPGRVPAISDTDGGMSWFGSGTRGTKSIELRTVPKGQVITINNRVLFDGNGYRIKPAGYQFLDKLCQVVAKRNYPIEITGHTDSRPADEKLVHSNQELSSLRAMEVLKFFSTVGNVDPVRLTAFGCGDTRPIASNETRQTRQRNRRVDILLAQAVLSDLEGIYEENNSGFVLFKRFVFHIFN
jgi:chemotaxis protein MotB